MKWCYFISPLLFLLAVLTKETAITLPFALLICWKISNKGEKWYPPADQAVHWALFFIILLAFILLPGHGRLLEYSFDIRGISTNILAQINGITYLVSRFFMIDGLNIDPDLPVIKTFSPKLLMQAVMLFLPVAAAVLYFKKAPWFSFGIFWFFLHLLPTNSIVPRLDVANERHLYLPSAGLFFIAAVAFSKYYAGLKSKYTIPAKVLLVLTFTALSFYTIKRNNVYKSETALWEDTVSKSPVNARAYNNLGYAYYLDARYNEAEKAFLDALRLKPDYVLARGNLEQCIKKHQ